VKADGDPVPCSDEFKPNWYNTKMPYCDDKGFIIQYDCNIKNIVGASD
jgi:hypothetical protein